MNGLCCEMCCLLPSKKEPSSRRRIRCHPWDSVSQLHRINWNFVRIFCPALFFVFSICFMVYSWASNSTVLFTLYYVVLYPIMNGIISRSYYNILRGFGNNGATSEQTCNFSGERGATMPPTPPLQLPSSRHCLLTWPKLVTPGHTI